MEDLINSWSIALNRVGRTFCDHGAAMLVQSTLLIVSLLVVDLVLRKRVRATLRSWIWMLVFIKLLLPPALSLPTGIGYWWGDRVSRITPTFDRASSGPAPHAEVGGAMPEHIATPIEAKPVDRSPANPESTTPIVPETEFSTPLTWQAVVFSLWLVGVLVFVALLVQRIFFVRALVLQSQPAASPLREMLDRCRAQIGVEREIELRVSPDTLSPAVCGLVRPTILMPANLLAKLSPEALEAVLIHELAHIKRGDLWINSAQTVLQIVYFYNPFLWLANAIVRGIREQAVDEMVLVALGAEAKSYSRTLIDVAQMAFFRASLALRLIGVAESKRSLERRIRHMIARPIPRTAKLGLIGSLIVVAIGAVLLPMARGRTQPTAEEATTHERFVAALPEGVTVELVGLCQDPSKPGQPWWRPDGTPMDEPEINRSLDGPQPYGALGYLLRFSRSHEVHYRDSTRVGHLLFRPGAVGTDGQAVVYGRQNTRHAPSPPDHGDIEIRVAGGEWITYDDGLASMMGGDLSRIRRVHLLHQRLFIILPCGSHIILSGLRPNPKTRGPETLIEATSMATNVNIQLECTAADGSVHTSSARHMAAFKPLTQHTFGFPVSMQDIAQIRLKYRPSHRVTFKNVSLRPGTRTDVQVRAMTADGVDLGPGPLDAKDLKARVESAKQLSELGKALLIYANDYNDRFPSTLQEARDHISENGDLSWVLENVTYLGQGVSPARANPGDVLVPGFPCGLRDARSA
ncbi:MAG: M56 family metallopeptidase [Planctomycetota bacterium]|jgi:beta-lactamase regulating signal transducer with metallopeptidase domain